MATKAEMDAFHADQREVVCASFAQAAKVALAAGYEFTRFEQTQLEDLASEVDTPLALNWMWRDNQNRFVWIHGQVEPGRDIKLVYLASEWPEGKAPALPVAPAPGSIKRRPSAGPSM